MALVLSGKAGDAAEMFGIIGASFGPICGAMTADYLLAGCKWPGPRAGFNPAGWLSWIVGFYVGAIGMIARAAEAPAFIEKFPQVASVLSKVAIPVPCPPVAAIIVGFVLYIILAKVGLVTRTLEMPNVASGQGVSQFRSVCTPEPSLPCGETVLSVGPCHCASGDCPAAAA